MHFVKIKIIPIFSNSYQINIAYFKIPLYPKITMQSRPTFLKRFKLLIFHKKRERGTRPALFRIQRRLRLVQHGMIVEVACEGHVDGADDGQG